jgi:hypothetical protein
MLAPTHPRLAPPAVLSRADLAAMLAAIEERGVSAGSSPPQPAIHRSLMVVPWTVSPALVASSATAPDAADAALQLPRDRGSCPRPQRARTARNVAGHPGARVRRPRANLPRLLPAASAQPPTFRANAPRSPFVALSLALMPANLSHGLHDAGKKKKKKTNFIRIWTWSYTQPYATLCASSSASRSRRSATMKGAAAAGI